MLRSGEPQPVSWGGWPSTGGWGWWEVEVVGMGGEKSLTSEVEGAVDAYCRLLLELSQALRGSFIHHQVQGLV